MRTIKAAAAGAPLDGRDDGLFGPVDLGSLHLRNRAVMAPLTRDRARRDGVPSEHASA